jgi:glycosyltransferase involved in cell wall biosynthesis
MRHICIQQNSREYPDIVTYLEELGFQRIVLGIGGARFNTKLALIWQTLYASARLLARVGEIRNMEIVVAFGHFAYVIKALARLGVIRYQKLFCFSFFVHSPVWLRVFRLLSRMDGASDHYVIFSQSEIELYAERLRIDRSRMHYLPYGDWSSEWEQAWLNTQAVDPPPPDDYYFAGGYSNRDYLALIEAFRRIPARLIIVCSRLNKDVQSGSLPSNVEVLRDIPTHVFEAYINHAKAGIVPLKHDTGASGQSVILRLMRNAKLTIASDMGAVRPYVEDGVTGYLVGDLVRELPEVIARVEEDPAATARMGNAALEKYKQCFSRRSVAALCRSILLETAGPGKVPSASGPPPEDLHRSDAAEYRDSDRAIRA